MSYPNYLYNAMTKPSNEEIARIVKERIEGFMAAKLTAVSDQDTESLLTEAEINEPTKRPYLAVTVGAGKVHAWTVNGFKCGRNYHNWFIDQREPDVTCKQCLRVLAAEKQQSS